MSDIDLVELLTVESKNDYLKKDNSPLIKQTLSEPKTINSKNNIEVPVILQTNQQVTSTENNIREQNKYSESKMESQNISINWTPNGLSLFVPIQTGALETKQTYSQPVLTELQPNNTQANFSSKLQELETKLEQITSALNNLTEKIAQNSLQTETNKDELNSQVQEQTELNDLNVTGASNGTESEVEVIEEEKKLEDSINSAVKEQEEETTNQLSEQEDKLKLLKVSNYDLYAECYENAKEIFDYLDDKQLKVAALSLYQATYKRRNHNSLEGAYSVE
jgi:hypothetical protein